MYDYLNSKNNPVCGTCANDNCKGQRGAACRYSRFLKIAEAIFNDDVILRSYSRVPELSREFTNPRLSDNEVIFITSRKRSKSPGGEKYVFSIECPEIYKDLPIHEINLNGYRRLMGW